MSTAMTDPLYQAEMRDRITRLQDMLESMEQADELEVKHAFLTGAYFRECHIPKDTIGCGKIHAGDTCNLVTRGRILIVTEHGSGEFRAGQMFMTPPSTKKAYWALEDTCFINAQITDETDLVKIEEDVIQKDYNPIQIQHKEKPPVPEEVLSYSASVEVTL